MLLLRDVQLVLGYNFLTSLDITEVYSTLKFPKTYFAKVCAVVWGKADLLVAGGSGGAELLSLAQLPPATTRNHPPPSFIHLLLSCVYGDGSDQYSTWTAGGNLFLFEKRGGKSHFVIILVSAVLGI